MSLSLMSFQEFFQFEAQSLTRSCAGNMVYMTDLVGKLVSREVLAAESFQGGAVNLSARFTYYEKDRNLAQKLMLAGYHGAVSHPGEFQRDFLESCLAIVRRGAVALPISYESSEAKKWALIRGIRWLSICPIRSPLSLLSSGEFTIFPGVPTIVFRPPKNAP
jgi:hypothetical protein